MNKETNENKSLKTFKTEFDDLDFEIINEGLGFHHSASNKNFKKNQTKKLIEKDLNQVTSVADAIEGNIRLADIDRGELNAFYYPSNSESVEVAQVSSAEYAANSSEQVITDYKLWLSSLIDLVVTCLMFMTALVALSYWFMGGLDIISIKKLALNLSPVMILYHFILTSLQLKVESATIGMKLLSVHTKKIKLMRATELSIGLFLLFISLGTISQKKNYV